MILLRIFSILILFFSMHAHATTLQQLENQIDLIRVEENVPGLSLVIVNNKEIVHQAYFGTADRQKGIPIESDTVFRIGSITKTFTSLALLHLVEQKKLNLDDKAAKYIKNLPYDNPYRSETAVRIAHLLEHTAGLKDLTEQEFGFKQPGWSLEQSFAFQPSSRIIAWTPGQYSSYTNNGAGIAAHLLEKVEKQNFEEFVQQQIFQPLQLQDATFFLTEDIKSRLAVGYDSDGESVIPYWHMIYRPFGAINMRVTDMVPFMQMLLNYGVVNNQTLFLKSSIQRLEQPKTSLAARNGLNYGYGLGNYQWLTNNVLFHGHGGDADGYLSRYGYTRENNTGYFVVINAFNNRALRKIRNKIENWITQDVEIKKYPSKYLLDQAQEDEILGTYTAVTQRFSWDSTNKKPSLEVFKKESKYFTKLDSGITKQLIPISAKHFRRRNQPIATISIVKDKQGRTVLQGDIGNFRKIK